VANLAIMLDETTATHPNRVALIHDDEQLTYAELRDVSHQIANHLVAHGIEPGDRVALSCPNIPWFTAIYFGILKAGAVVVPLNVLLKPREIAYHLKDSGAKAYFAFEGSPDLPIGAAASEAFDQVADCSMLSVFGLELVAWADQSRRFATVERHDDDTAVILYTSGTTGQPKGAELRHRNMRHNALVTDRVFGVDESRPDTYLCVLPLYHSFGQSVIQNSAVAYGGTVVMQARFEARAALDLMRERKVTFFAGVPTMYWSLLEAADRIAELSAIAENLRIGISGAAALPAQLHQDFSDVFDVELLEGYGLSETSPVASFMPLDQPARIGSVGKPIPGVQMKLINDDWSDLTGGDREVGEIAIKGDNVMKGYHNRPDATAEVIRDGWFRTGDLARKDSDGYYFIVDRSKDMIIRGGYNVYPRELEEVLMSHPAVSQVAVVGIPHESHGEEIMAVVVKTKKHDAVSERDLVTWGKKEFASYKYPRIVTFVDALPLTSTGKILKRQLSRRVADQSSGGTGNHKQEMS